MRRYIYKKHFKKFEQKITIGDFVKITEPRNILIGENTTFLSGDFLYAHDKGSIDIGKNCSFNSNVILDASQNGVIKIYDNCLIGPNVVFRAADHKFNRKKANINSQGHNRGVITVQKNVWIGANCVITRNVTISEGCVVGAGSIVTKNLPAYTVCCGVPAREIRKR